MFVLFCKLFFSSLSIWAAVWFNRFEDVQTCCGEGGGRTLDKGVGENWLVQLWNGQAPTPLCWIS
jgi:hypothetical protein